jgi:hypothetical protein
VTALLDLSGTRGPRGDAQRTAMQQWVDAQRGTPRVKLRIVDVAGSDARLLLELKRAADAQDTDAFIVGVPAVLDDTLASAIALVGRPVLFTLPIAEPTGAAARWDRPRARRCAADAQHAIDHRHERLAPRRARGPGARGGLPCGRAASAVRHERRA